MAGPALKIVLMGGDLVRGVIGPAASLAALGIALGAGCSSEAPPQGDDSGSGVMLTAGATGTATGGISSGASGHGLRLDVGGSVGTDTEGETEGGDCNQTLMATVRDFQQSHPDFEYVIGGRPRASSQPMLGGDRSRCTPGSPTTPTTTARTSFDQWYRDVPGVNIASPS